MRYLLSLGSNMPDKPDKLRETLDRLSEQEGLTVVKATDLYETPDMAGGVRNYLNAVVEIESRRTASGLTALFKDMELDMGRDKCARQRGDVPIDIDIVTCDGKILRAKDYNTQFFRQGLQRLKESEKTEKGK